MVEESRSCRRVEGPLCRPADTVEAPTPVNILSTAMDPKPKSVFDAVLNKVWCRKKTFPFISPKNSLTLGSQPWLADTASSFTFHSCGVCGCSHFPMWSHGACFSSAFSFSSPSSHQWFSFTVADGFQETWHVSALHTTAPKDIELTI